MNEKDWLDAATEKIRFGPDRMAVRQELAAHLEDLREKSGLEEESALQSMGDPGEIAEELGQLHKPWLGYLWQMSRAMLIGAAAVYCLLLAALIISPGRSHLFPARMLYNYLTWDGRSVLEIEETLSERELPAGKTVKTDGVTICVDQAILLPTGEGGMRQDLYLALDVNLGWRGDYLDWYAISDVRDNAGTIAHNRRRDASVHWAHWQKIAFAVKSLPEDAEWVELDFGYGELRRTLHIDLAEETET